MSKKVKVVVRGAYGNHKPGSTITVSPELAKVGLGSGAFVTPENANQAIDPDAKILLAQAEAEIKTLKAENAKLLEGGDDAALKTANDKIKTASDRIADLEKQVLEFKTQTEGLPELLTELGVADVAALKASLG